MTGRDIGISEPRSEPVFGSSVAFWNISDNFSVCHLGLTSPTQSIGAPVFFTYSQRALPPFGPQVGKMGLKIHVKREISLEIIMRAPPLNRYSAPYVIFIRLIIFDAVTSPRTNGEDRFLLAGCHTSWVPYSMYSISCMPFIFCLDRSKPQSVATAVSRPLILI